MTFDAFRKKYTNKPVDFDGYYGNQCMDLYRQYVKDVLGFPQSRGVFGAKDVWHSYLFEYFDRVKNTPYAIPKKGDIMIWSKTPSNPYGHIAIFVKGDVNSFVSFDQNWPVGSLPHEQKHDYRDVLGWLTPKKTDTIEDMGKIQALTKQVKRLQAEVRKLTTLVHAGETQEGVLERTIIEISKQRDEEIGFKISAETKLDKAITAKNKAKEDLKKCQQGENTKLQAIWKILMG